MKELYSRCHIHRYGWAMVVAICSFFLFPEIGQAQTITLSLGEVSVQEAVTALNKQENFSVVVKSASVDMNRKVWISAKEASIDEVLSQIFVGQDVDCKVSGKSIVVTKAEQKLTVTTAPQPKPNAAITGQVVDGDGEPLVGAGVFIDGTKTGTVTDLDGYFTFKEVSFPLRLVVTFIGYDAEEVDLTGREAMPVRITMKSSQNYLDETVVVGYGTQKRVNLTGAVGIIEGKDLNKRPVTNAAQAIQGADPSLLLTMDNGSIEGKNYNVQIRGAVSLNSGSPLILVDGVEASLTQVNPNDIESVSVLKDASACAIYGATASAGVVLITTKDGKAGQAKVTYSGRFGVAWNTTSTDFLTTGYDYVVLSNEFCLHSTKGYEAWNYTDEEMEMLYARRNDKKENPDRPWVYVDSDGKYRYLGNFDWYGYMFKRSRPETEHNITINGGNDKVNYYISGRYLYREGLFDAGAADYYHGLSFRAKVNAQVSSWAKWTTNLSFENTQYDYGGYWEQDGTEGLTSIGILWNVTQNISPTLVPVNPDGTTMMYTNGIQFADSPIASGRGGVWTDGRNDNRRTNNYWILTNKLVADLLPNKDLQLTLDYTYRRRDKLGTYRSYPTANTWDKNMKEIVEFTNGSIYDFYEEDRYYYNGHVANAYLSYNHSWGKHNFTAVAGGQFQDFRSSTMEIRQTGSLSDNLAYIDMASGTIEKAEESNTAYRTLGFFARLNYDFAGKYLFEVSGRYDGTSRFSSSHRWAFYPSASAGWRISEEKFWSPLSGWWNNAKIRLSYGSLGNQQVSNYSYISTLSTNQMTYTFDGSTKANYVSTPSAITDGLTWETVITYNLGFDFGFFHNKLVASADFYIRDTKDMLTSAKTLPSVYGTSSPEVNGADLRTKGYEITLSWKDQFSLLGSQFYYTVSGSIGDYKTTITKFDNDSKLLSSYYEGQTLGEIWGYHVEGLFKTDREAAEYQATIDDTAVNNGVYNCGVAEYAKLLAGDLKFADLNGDGVIDNGSNTADDSGDRRIIGNSLPRYLYSLRGDIEWKGITLSVFFQGVGKCDWYPSANCSYFWGLYGFPASSFIPSNYSDITWSEDNRNTYFPRRRGYQTSSSAAAYVTNDYYLQNAAYIRLKNITLGYDIPFKKIKAIEKCRVYVTGENLWYWSPMKKHTKYVDPEVAVSSAYGDCLYPYSRTLSVGIDLTF